MTVWGLSVRAMPVILSIVSVRALALHRMPKRVFSALWGLAIFALLVPVQPRLPLPSVSLPMGRLEAPKARALPMRQEGVALPGGFLPGEGDGEPVTKDEPSANIPWAKLLWIAVSGGMAMYFAQSHIRYRLRYRFAVPCEDENVRKWLRQNAIRRSVKIKVSGDISAALTYGVLRPVILLPKTTDWKDERSLQYVLLHEMTHIRHHDVVWKACLCAALCVHWFNPLVWVMFALANRDLELICDESVLRAVGASGKTEYAMTLVTLAERQIKMTQFGMAFGKNAIEERILAIMKTKKISHLTTILAVALILGVTVGFTVTGQAATDAPPEAGQDAARDAEKIYSVSYKESEGEIVYGGKGVTWSSVTDGVVQDAANLSQAEWWTAEEYAEWLEQEKLELQSCIGAKGWTPSTGWFTWDQQSVDEAIALYEQTLRDIQSGMRVSKPTDSGDEMLMISYDPEEKAVSMEEADVSVGVALSFGIDTAANEAVDLKEYAPFGLVEKDGRLYFNGEPVAYFTDRVELDGMAFVRCSWWNPEKSGLFLHTVRQSAPNPDGSVDPFGKLIGIEAYEDSEIDGITFLRQATAALEAVSLKENGVDGQTGEDNETGSGFMADFAKYAPFGVTFVRSGHFVNVCWNGEPVRILIDRAPDGAYRTIGSIDEGGIVLQTVYDSEGKISGVEPVDQ